MSETRIKTGENSTKGRVADHHRISVAPMMDWTDGAKTTNCNSDLCRRKIAVAFW